MNALSRLIALATALVIPVTLQAQTYPDRPVTLIVPYGAGAANDIFGRYIADGLSKIWGQPVVVENVPGAGAAIGIAEATQADPDGYTLLWASSSFSPNAAANKNLPFKFGEDLTPVAKVGDGTLLAITGTRVAIPTVQALQAEAKAQKIFFGATGPASITSFMATLMQSELGVEMEGVNYSGGSEALVDLIGGRIDLYIGTVTTALPAIEAGSATPIAVFSATRSPTLPDVPTIAEAGYPAAEAGIWWGIFAPKGLPDDILTKIHADVATVIAAPGAAQIFADQGAVPAGLPLGEFDDFVTGELAKWAALAEKYNIVVE